MPQADLSRALLDTVAQRNEESDWRGDERNVVLALARIWFSASTGAIARKDVAAEWALGRLPREHGSVLPSAHAAYLGSAEDDLASRSGEVVAFVRYTKAVIEGIFTVRAGER